MARSEQESSDTSMYDRIRRRRQLHQLSQLSDRSNSDSAMAENSPPLHTASSSSSSWNPPSTNTPPRSHLYGAHAASEPPSPSRRTDSFRRDQNIPSALIDLTQADDQVAAWEMRELETLRHIRDGSNGRRRHMPHRSSGHDVWDSESDFMGDLSADEREVFETELRGFAKNTRWQNGEEQATDTPGALWNLFRSSRRRDGGRPPQRASDPRTYNPDIDWSYRSNTPSIEDPKPPAAFLYSVEPARTGSDVWPDLRDRSKVPAKYFPIDLQRPKPSVRARTSLVSGWKSSTDSCDQKPEPGPNPTWPMGQLPSEIYYLITDSLARDDIKAMRLTCRELEHHISCVLFKTVVVPFNTEIYGMLQGTSNGKFDSKGKGKMKADPATVGFWKNSTAEDIYTGHGIDVFRSFGSRMKKFGMSFEVDEDALANPPLKGSREAHKSYWGEYTWPYPEYHRFEQVAGLEDAADETPRMKFAFSLLGSVQELALSLDSGLGWIAGPDQSLRSRVLRKPPPVFGTVHKVQERQVQAQMDFWELLKRKSGEPGGCDLRQATFYHREMAADRMEFQNLRNSFIESADRLEIPFINLHQIIDPTVTGAVKLAEQVASQTPGLFGNPETPLISPNDMLLDDTENEDRSDREIVGGMLMVKEDTADQERFENYPIVPTNLSKMQKEWLLETEWAQRAFLSSYLLAIVDNRNTFHNVHTINFSRISSRYLLSLARNDFWNALPNLKSVNLQVIADWRDVVKDNAGFVETPRVTLAAATSWFYRLLFYMIIPRQNITSLNIGWACGGEHAQGLHARNKHLMPAPFLSNDWMSTPENMANKEMMVRGMIDFRYIEELTLTNCWLPPDALVALVTKHDRLTKLVLDSVSLSAPLTIYNGINAPMPALPPIAVPALGVNPNQGPGPGGFAHLTAPQLQYWQNLQAQAVAQVQGLAHNMPNPNFPPQWANLNIAPLPPPQQPATATSWLGQHRPGSWPHVIDTISPGATLALHGSTTSPTNVVIMNSSSSLRVLEFRSCGYCRLNNCRFDESAITLPTNHGSNAWFTKRFQALNKVMMKDKYNWVADIVQHIPQHEEEALEMGWDMRLGWEDEDEAEGPTYDACLPGGTGRFSGGVTIASRAAPNEVDE